MTTTDPTDAPTMPAARYHGPGAGLSVDTVPVPEPGPGEAVVRVTAAGVCHTELQFLGGTLNLGVSPLTLGHEIAGEVAAHGDGVDGLAVGDRVAVYYYTPCDECAWCLAGHEQLCPNMGPQIGFTGDGGFAPYVRVRARNLLALPSGLDPAEAAPLCCSAATALHAARAVAGVAPGETVVVYGVGAVGFSLIQVARLLGARVIAVGRSPAKLVLARELGAEVCVDASAGDAVAAVQAATGREGADVVFDLVGSAETLANGLPMLRRRGRLVIVGYGEDRLNVNPLHLVLRELQVRAAVGCTRAELREVLDLAAAGKLRAVVAHRAPLGDVNEALAAVARGDVVGRVVLEPSPASPEVAVVVGNASARPFERELLAFVGRWVDAPADDTAFDDLARRLFAYQFAGNRAYGTFCRRRGRTPETVRHWRDIPAVPIAAFKETLLLCEPADGAREFNSSGTTRPEHKSRHLHPSLAVYDANAAANFQAHVLPDGARPPMLVLFPREAELPNSSLAHWLELMARRFSADGGRWFVGPDGLRADDLTAALRAAEHGGEPVCLLAASFALVHYLEHCEESGLRFRLPPGSRLMDTGGYKGKSREFPKEELYGMVGDRLGVPADHIVNMYGMTEHSTQFLDAVLRDRVRGVIGPRYKTVPPWARTLVLDPDTLKPVPAGAVGLLCHVDLANRASAIAVLSEDLGHEIGGGFELIGRVRGSEARGCSIALDELLSAARG